MKRFAGFLLLGMLIVAAGCATTDDDMLEKPKKTKKSQTTAERHRNRETPPPTLLSGGLTAREQELYLEKNTGSSPSSIGDADFKARSQQSAEWVFGSWYPTDRGKRKVIPFSD